MDNFEKIQCLIDDKELTLSQKIIALWIWWYSSIPLKKMKESEMARKGIIKLTNPEIVKAIEYICDTSCEAGVLGGEYTNDPSVTVKKLFDVSGN